MLGAAFDQIRAAAAGKQRVLACIAENLAKLRSLAPSSRQPALERQLELLEAAAMRSLREPAEVQAVLGRIRESRHPIAARSA